jgi:hypothetical protein
MSEVSRPAKSFTPKQGQYLAYIYAYTRLHRRPPAAEVLVEPLVTGSRMSKGAKGVGYPLGLGGTLYAASGRIEVPP